MILASAAPEPTEEGWPGNPIGNIIRIFTPWSEISQKIFILDELNSDDFYTFLGGTIPIMDENRRTIALLGIDYPVGSELNKLKTLKWICVAVVLDGGSSQGAGCTNILAWPLHYKEKGLERAVLGGFDPSARKFMKYDELTFTVPLSLYRKMLKALPESMFNVGKDWAVVRKKVNRSKKAWGEED